MVSFLCDVHYDALDRKLTDLEIAGIVHTMIIGGLETTQYTLKEQAQLLCEHPATFERLRHDRAKVRSFAEEGMRMRSPTHGLSTRVTAQDEVFQGVAVPAGSLLHLRSARPTSTRRSSPARSISTSTGTDSPATWRSPRVHGSVREPTCRVSSNRSRGVCCWTGSSRSSTATATTGCAKQGIMLGTLKLNLRFTKADPPLSLGTGRTAGTH